MPEVCKLCPVGLIQPTSCFHKVLLEHSSAGQTPNHLSKVMECHSRDLHYVKFCHATKVTLETFSPLGFEEASCHVVRGPVDRTTRQGTTGGL